jgi:hypothetical protein
MITPSIATILVGFFGFLATLSGVWLTLRFNARADERRLQAEGRSRLHSDRMSAYRRLRILFGRHRDAVDHARFEWGLLDDVRLNASKAREWEKQQMTTAIETHRHAADQATEEMSKASEHLTEALSLLDLVATEHVRDAARALGDALNPYGPSDFEGSPREPEHEDDKALIELQRHSQEVHTPGSTFGKRSERSLASRRESSYQSAMFRWGPAPKPRT